MDSLDKKILNIIQTKFPITQKPYEAIGREAGISEKETIDRIANLKKEGIIRRIGATFDPKKLGFTSSLCAAKVPKEKIDEFVNVVNSYPGITHNYERDHQYNIWFTFIAESMDEIEKSLKEISEKTGITDIKNLPTVRFFKIKVDFDMSK
ncbi:MAG: transcriptional regulator [Deltaproteobacteria bacterium GWC2_42_11]|nr:MAG: transcriptional regulator [Deltaproteobacteria bacterium GWC2_42_11]HBO84911.1 Lrp/AsnC family transcriptional regulator [Deltaproteobacteria bacterium]